MRIKNKTELRTELMSAAGSTGILDYIEVYSDGSWDRMSCTSYSENYVDRRTIGAYLASRWERSTSREAISMTFAEIETLLSNPGEREYNPHH